MKLNKLKEFLKELAEKNNWGDDKELMSEIEILTYVKDNENGD